VLWLLPHLSSWPRRIVGLVGLAAFIGLSSQIQMAHDHQGWMPWSADAVNDARRAGRPVLVDFSAAWCVTCLVNERVALENSAVVARLQHDGVVLLKGDWTNPNSAITAELDRQGQGGIPLYLLYPSDAHKEAVVLPQILTPTLVLQALDRIEDVRP
jgi:thiol:disulfide interchange protein